MQKHINLKRIALLIGLLMPTIWCGAFNLSLTDSHSHILIKEGNVQEMPRSNAINASIGGHTLTVVFTENLGQVGVEVTTFSGGYVQANSCITPNGIQFYIPLAGDYIVTFTLANGDVYYGEFTVTD